MLALLPKGVFLAGVEAILFADEHAGLAVGLYKRQIRDCEMRRPSTVLAGDVVLCISKLVPYWLTVWMKLRLLESQPPRAVDLGSSVGRLVLARRFTMLECNRSWSSWKVR